MNDSLSVLCKFLEKMLYFRSMFWMFTKVLKGTKDGLLVTFIKWQGREWGTIDTIMNFDKCTVELLIYQHGFKISIYNLLPPPPMKLHLREVRTQFHQEIYCQVHWGHHSKMKHRVLQVLNGWNCSRDPGITISIKSQIRMATYCLILPLMQESQPFKQFLSSASEVIPPSLLVQKPVLIKLDTL